MRRRDLFGKFAAAAAAVAAAPMVKTAEAAPAETVLPAGDVHLDSYWKGWDDAPKQAGRSMGVNVVAHGHGYTIPDSILVHGDATYEPFITINKHKYASVAIEDLT